jgi:hypothetical protein
MSIKREKNMSTTVNIFIKGVAICYKKRLYTEYDETYRWRILFPFDDEGCHPVNFSWSKEGETSTAPIPLANPRGWINVAVSGEVANPDEVEDDDFKNHVLDMTQHTANGRKTHQSLQLLDPDGETERWKEGTVLMTFEGPAKFSVTEYLEDPRVPELELSEHNGNALATSKQKPGKVAHTVQAIIELPGEGEVLITSGGLAKPLPPFSGGVYNLTFDNDCKEVKPGHNDMDLFYEKTIIEKAHPQRRFIIGDRAPNHPAESFAAAAPPLDTPDLGTGPPDLAAGKPCLSVKVSETSDDQFP